jgi:hypothetical protein
MSGLGGKQTFHITSDRNSIIAYVFHHGHHWKLGCLMAWFDACKNEWLWTQDCSLHVKGNSNAMGTNIASSIR